MIKKFGCLAFFLMCLVPVYSFAQTNSLFDDQMMVPQIAAPMDIQPPVTAPIPASPPATITAIDAERIRGVTNTLMQYPDQTPQILNNYLGIDTTKINFEKFMPIVQSGDYQTIYDQVSLLYTNSAGFNSGALANLNYYQAAVPVPPPIIAASSTPIPAASAYMSSATFYTALGVATAGAAGAAAAIGSGGGSGGHGSSSTTGDDAFGRDALPNLVDPATLVDAEFSAYNLDALNSEKAQYAYAKGLTGNGVTIGFYDRFNSNLAVDSELSARVTYSNYDIPNDQADTDSQTAGCIGHETEDYCDHGRTVIEYAAAAHNGAGTQGVAFQASVMAESWNASLNARNLADQNPDIINFSCGSCATLADVQYIAGKNILMTSATGNDPADPSPIPFTPAYYVGDATVNNSIIAVTGTYLSGGIWVNPYTPCGVTSNNCMTAISDSGTSFAAPQVAGAAALIKEGWSFLTAKQIANILLSSAQDIGAPGVDAVYGHGLLDIKAAVSPVGGITAFSSRGAFARFAPSTISQNQSTPFGDAFSNAKNAKGNVVVIDSFGRDFNIKTQDNLIVVQKDNFSPDMMKSIGKTTNLKTVNYSDNLSMKFNQGSVEDGDNAIAGFAEYKLNPVTKFTLGFSSDIDTIADTSVQKFNTANFISADIFKNGFLNFSDNNQVYYQAVELASGKNIKTKFSTYYSKNSDVDYFKSLDNQVTSDYTATMAETRFSPVNHVDVNVKNGVTHEFNSLLGSKFTGSFDMANGANTYFTGLDVSYDLTPHWNLFGSYLFGNTQTTPGINSAFNSVSDILSDSFALTATRSELTGHDKLSFSVGQPTRVRSGTASGLTAQVDHTTGVVSTAHFEQDLTPSGRTLLFQAAYQKDLSDTIGMNFAVEYTQEPYQQINADPEASALMKVTYKFK